MWLLFQKMVVYGCLGVLLEVFFTGFHSIIILRDRNAICRTSLHMIPVYGLGAIGMGAMRSLLPSTLLFVPLATLFIFVVEFLSGWIFRLLKIKIWDYSHAKFNIHGLVRADYIPFWLMVAVAFDQLADYVTKVLELAGRMAQ